MSTVIVFLGINKYNTDKKLKKVTRDCADTKRIAEHLKIKFIPFNYDDCTFGNILCFLEDIKKVIVKYENVLYIVDGHGWIELEKAAYFVSCDDKVIHALSLIAMYHPHHWSKRNKSRYFYIFDMCFDSYTTDMFESFKYKTHVQPQRFSMEALSTRYLQSAVLMVNKSFHVYENDDNGHLMKFILTELKHAAFNNPNNEGLDLLDLVRKGCVKHSQQCDKDCSGFTLHDAEIKEFILTPTIFTSTSERLTEIFNNLMLFLSSPSSVPSLRIYKGGSINSNNIDSNINIDDMRIIFGYILTLYDNLDDNLDDTLLFINIDSTKIVELIYNYYHNSKMSNEYDEYDEYDDDNKNDDNKCDDNGNQTDITNCCCVDGDGDFVKYDKASKVSNLSTIECKAFECPYMMNKLVSVYYCKHCRYLICNKCYNNSISNNVNSTRNELIKFIKNESIKIDEKEYVLKYKKSVFVLVGKNNLNASIGRWVENKNDVKLPHYVVGQQNTGKHGSHSKMWNICKKCHKKYGGKNRQKMHKC